MKNPEAYLESLIDLLDTSNNNQEVASNVFKNKLDMQEKYMGLVPDTLLDFIVNQFRPGMTYKEGDILFKKYSTFSQGGSVTTPKRGLVNEPGSYGGAKGSIFSKTQLQLDKLEESVTKSNNSYKRAPYAKELLKEAGFFYKTSEMSPATGEEAKKILSKLLTTEQKIEAYVNNVMLQENSFLKDFESPFKHIQNKFGTSTVTLANWAKTSQAFKDNETLFKHLANQPSVNKYKIKPDGSPRTIFEYSDILQNKLPSSKLNLRGNNAVNFILQSAERNYSRSKTLGKEASVTFVTNPETTPINQWQFIDNDTNRLFSVDPTIDEVLFKGTTYKNNYLNNVNAEKLYAKEFGGVYKMFNEDLPKYLEATFVDKDGKTKKVDTALRQKYYSQTGKKDFLMRRASEIDHLDLLNDPFGKKKGNLRLIGRFENTQAGSMRNYNKYIDDPKLKKKVLKEIGYSNSDKNVDNYISRVIQTINDPLIKIKGGATFITTPEGRLAQKKLVSSVSVQKVLKQNGIVIPGCGRIKKNVGGRITFSNGSCGGFDNADDFAKGDPENFLKTVQNDPKASKLMREADPSNFQKILKSVVKDTKSPFGFIGGDIIISTLFGAGALEEGKTGLEASDTALWFLPREVLDAYPKALTEGYNEKDAIKIRQALNLEIADNNYFKNKDELDNFEKARKEKPELFTAIGGQQIENTVERLKNNMNKYFNKADEIIGNFGIRDIPYPPGEGPTGDDIQKYYEDINPLLKEAKIKKTERDVNKARSFELGRELQKKLNDILMPDAFEKILGKGNKDYQDYNILGEKSGIFTDYMPSPARPLAPATATIGRLAGSYATTNLPYADKLKNYLENIAISRGKKSFFDPHFNFQNNLVNPNNITQEQYDAANPQLFYSGGIAGLSGGVKSGIAPRRGPNPQGLASLKEYDKQY